MGCSQTPKNASPYSLAPRTAQSPARKYQESSLASKNECQKSNQVEIIPPQNAISSSTVTIAQKLLQDEITPLHIVKDTKNDERQIVKDIPIVNSTTINTNGKTASSGEGKSNLKDKELRQKELRLKKWEEELKQQNAANSDTTSNNAKLQSHVLKLEAKIRELENSNRILRIKVAGSVENSTISPGGQNVCRNDTGENALPTHENPQ